MSGCSASGLRCAGGVAPTALGGWGGAGSQPCRAGLTFGVGPPGRSRISEAECGHPIWCPTGGGWRSSHISEARCGAVELWCWVDVWCDHGRRHETASNMGHPAEEGATAPGLKPRLGRTDFPRAKVRCYSKTAYRLVSDVPGGMLACWETRPRRHPGRCAPPEK